MGRNIIYPEVVIYIYTVGKVCESVFDFFDFKMCKVISSAIQKTGYFNFALRNIFFFK